jgi:hypothetical protein
MIRAAPIRLIWIGLLGSLWFRWWLAPGGGGNGSDVELWFTSINASWPTQSRRISAASLPHVILDGVLIPGLPVPGEEDHPRRRRAR